MVALTFTKPLVVFVGNCLQDWTTNTLTRKPDFFFFIDHRKKNLFPLKITKSRSINARVLLSEFGFQLKGSKVQGYQIPTNHIVYNQNKAKIALTITKATNNNNTPHNFRHLKHMR